MATASKARDKRWAVAVMERYDGKCPHCNEEADGPHHIVPRGNRSTRYVLENGLNACLRLHRRFEAKGKVRRKAIRIYVGEERYDNLQKIAHGQARPEDFGYKVVE